jgi:hypothetical protein
MKVQIGPANGIPEMGHDGFGILPEFWRAIVLNGIGPKGCADYGPTGG